MKKLINNNQHKMYYNTQHVFIHLILPTTTLFVLK